MLQVLDIQSSRTASKILKQHSNMTLETEHIETEHILKRIQRLVLKVTFLQSDDYGSYIYLSVND